MKLIKDKKILVAADWAGFPLKEVIVEYLESKGWEVTDIGVKDPDDPNVEMFHRIGLRAGSMITEKEFERAIIFCGTGMGVHLAAAKCPGVRCGVVESVPAARRCVIGNDVNVLSLGAWYVAPEMGKAAVDAFLSANFGDDHDWWPGFYEYHKIAVDEMDAFDYDEYKANNFQVKKLGDMTLSLVDKPEEA